MKAGRRSAMCAARIFLNVLVLAFASFGSTLPRLRQAAQEGSATCKGTIAPTRSGIGSEATTRNAAATLSTYRYQRVTKQRNQAATCSDSVLPAGKKKVVTR
jgi:hypothetical protein